MYIIKVVVIWWGYTYGTGRYRFFGTYKQRLVLNTIFFGLGIAILRFLSAFSENSYTPWSNMAYIDYMMYTKEGLSYKHSSLRLFFCTCPNKWCLVCIFFIHFSCGNLITQRPETKQVRSGRQTTTCNNKTIVFHRALALTWITVNSCPEAVLTVEARISWGQHPSRKLLHTFESENFSVYLLASPVSKLRVITIDYRVFNQIMHYFKGGNNCE